MLDGNVLLRQKRDEVPDGTLSCPAQNLADFHHYRHYEGLRLLPSEGLRLLPSVCDSKLIQQTLIMISKQIILEYEQEEGNNESKTYIVYYFQKSFFPYLSKGDINEGHC